MVTDVFLLAVSLLRTWGNATTSQDDSDNEIERQEQVNGGRAKRVIVSLKEGGGVRVGYERDSRLTR